MTSVSFPNKQELSQIILREGTKIRHENLTLIYTLKQHPTKPTVISSISKKVSKLATSRNRIRRQLRGLLQHHAKEILPKYNWMWICKTAILTKEIQEAFIHDLKKLNAT